MKKKTGRKFVYDIGIAWFKPKDWKIIRGLSNEYGPFKESYFEWEQSALAFARKLRKQGYKVQKFTVNAHDIQKWCKEKHSIFDKILHMESPSTLNHPCIIHII